MLMPEYIQQQGQCSTTLDCGAFEYPLLPWKRNNTFPFIVAGVYVAVNNVSVHCATAFKNWFPLQWYRGTDYFVLLLKIYIVNQYYDTVPRYNEYNEYNNKCPYSCLSCPAFIAHLFCTYYTVNCVLSDSTILVHNNSWHDFLKQLLNTTSTLWFSPQL
jgi:hypothetical protein